MGCFLLYAVWLCYLEMNAARAFGRCAHDVVAEGVLCCCELNEAVGHMHPYRRQLSAVDREDAGPVVEGDVQQAEESLFRFC